MHGVGSFSNLPCKATCQQGHQRLTAPGVCRSTRCSVAASTQSRSLSNSHDMSRRANLAASILLPSVFFFQNEAAADALDEYVDPIDGFQFALPDGWALGTGSTESSLGSTSRRVVAIYPKDENPRDTNATVVVTTVAADYSKLGSFGTALDFGQNLVNSMDRSYLKRAAWKRQADDVQTAHLIDAYGKRGMFYIQYNVQIPPEPMKYLASMVAMGTVGMGNRLYTLTIQCPDQEAEKYKPDFQKILDSFTVPALVS